MLSNNLDQLFVELLEMRGLAQSTRKQYYFGVKNLAAYFENRSIESINEKDLHSYLFNLSKEGKLMNRHVEVCALRFFFKYVLPRDWAVLKLPFPRRKQSLPLVLNREQIYTIINFPKSTRDKAILYLCYGSGLRISEVLSLKVNQINFDSMLIHIKSSKGKKDRDVGLSTQQIKIINIYLETRSHINTEFLFPSKDQDSHIKPHNIRYLIADIRKHFKLTKEFRFHSFRHCFATHMLENGVDLLTLQNLMGHANLQATSRYVRLSSVRSQKTKSPLDC